MKVRRVQKGSEGFRRVQKSSEGLTRVKRVRRVKKVFILSKYPSKYSFLLSEKKKKRKLIN